MEKGQFKEELKGRYCYVYENAAKLLAAFTEQKKEIKKGLLKPEETYYVTEFGNIPYDKLIELESFLLSDVPYQESEFYKWLETRKLDKEYAKKVINGVQLLRDYNNEVYNPYLLVSLDAWMLLSKVRQFIAGQKSDRNNCIEKLHAMEEYFKIARYTNDGRVWRSGYLLAYYDVSYTINDIMTNNHNEAIYPREVGDYGLEESEMVLYLTNGNNINKDNNSILTENEKQEIFLSYHDELPWNLDMKCAIEDQATPTLVEFEMTRPDNTHPCGNHFYVKEEDIFINPKDRQYRYYMLCPHCGYIVHIPSNLINDTIKKRIEERCQKDPNLFRKKMLYSELLSLEEDPITRKRLSSK